MTIRCEIVSLDKIVFEGDVNMVVLPGIHGEIGVLPNHSPLLTMLSYGIITIKQGDKENVFTVYGGVAEVQPDQVTVLAEGAESVETIDVERAEMARKRAEELLNSGIPQISDQYASLQASLLRSNLRLAAARRFRRRGQTPPKPGEE
ncbi:MAG: ATP synthase F1 subunit epsilon [Chloroflexi bacterium]|nr:ATP synthase F1 subunit epsilon [Chloroflexota bacterium]